MIWLLVWINVISLQHGTIPYEVKAECYQAREFLLSRGMFADCQLLEPEEDTPIINNPLTLDGLVG